MILRGILHVKESINHCLQWRSAMAKYELFPSKGYRGLIKQVALVFHCPHCKNYLYRYYNLLANGHESDLKRISPFDWREKWQPRLELDRFDPSTLAFSKIELKVSEYSKKVHRPADKSIEYLKVH